MDKINKFLKERKLNIIGSACAVVLIFLIWIIAYYSVKNDYLIPSISATFKSFGECFISAEFWTAFSFTLLRTFSAFLLSFILAAALAALSSVSKIFSAIVSPFTAILRTVPTMAVILILLVWTTPKQAPVIVTCLVLLPIIYAQILTSLESIDAGVKNMAKVFSLTKAQKVFKIYLPHTLPSVLSQTGANISFGLKLTVSAEILCATYKSLGGLMQNAKLYLEMPRLAALTVLAVIAGFVIEAAFSQFKRITYAWSKPENIND